jgi:hypothetical protein
MVLSITSQFELHTRPGEDLDLRSNFVHELISQLKALTMAHVRQNTELLEELRRCFSDEDGGMRVVALHFFDTITLYFKRMLRENSCRTVTLCVLRSEL